jgi:hypothetical protein
LRNARHVLVKGAQDVVCTCEKEVLFARAE